MDTATIIAIIVLIILVYFFIKLILSPVIRALLGIVIFMILIYVLQRFGFDLDKILSPFGISLNINKWGLYFQWILGPINYFIDYIKNLFSNAFQNVPKLK